MLGLDITYNIRSLWLQPFQRYVWNPFDAWSVIRRLAIATFNQRWRL